MLKVKMMLEDIDSALFNLTGLNSSAVEMMDAAICGRGEAPSLNSDPPENTAGGGVEERTGGQRLRTQEPPVSTRRQGLFMVIHYFFFRLQQYLVPPKLTRLTLNF